MKPLNLQEAIKANALKKRDRFSKGEWKEPVVKQVKVTAEDVAAEKARGKKGGLVASGGGDGGGASPAEVMALKSELAMLRDEMRNSIKQLKENASSQGGAAPSAAPAHAVDDRLKQETEALRKELDSLKSDLSTMRGTVSKALDVIPEEMKELREELRQFQEDGAKTESNGASSGEADPALAKDVRKTKSEIKELRMMVSQSQDGTTLAKELRVIVDQQESTLETQAEEIEDLKEQVRVMKRRLETAEFTAKEALEMAKKKGNGAASEVFSPPSSPVPKVIPLSSPKSRSRKNAGDDDDRRLINEATGENKGQMLDLNSDDESSDGSDLYPSKNNPSNNGVRSRQGTENKGSAKATPKKFSPSSIVLDKNGTYNYEEGSGSDSDDDQNPTRNRNANTSLASKTYDSKDMSKNRTSGSQRRVVDDDDDDKSTTTDDDSDVPKKKTISLLPHRSETIYEEQRKDPVLRKFIVEAKSPDMTVHKVHGRNLVFFSEKVYIPATLRQKTMDYYKKKHSYNPLIAIQKHCFWPDLEDDMKKDNKGDRWRVEVNVKEEIH